MIRELRVAYDLDLDDRTNSVLDASSEAMDRIKEQIKRAVKLWMPRAAVVLLTVDGKQEEL